jgi:hypothetical protein
MLQAYNNSVQTLTKDQAISFDNTVVNNTPCHIGFTPGGTSIELRTQGYYLVEFNATAMATAAGDICINMAINGENTPQAAAGATLSAVGDYTDLSFNTIVQVKCSCCAVDNTKILTFENVCDSTSLTLANVVITKIA